MNVQPNDNIQGYSKKTSMLTEKLCLGKIAFFVTTYSNFVQLTMNFEARH